MANAALFIAIALVFALGKILLEKRLAPLDAAGDQRRLDDLAFTKGCSVYELFKAAGSVWNFSTSKIEADFRQYIHHDHVPPYVHDYLRKDLSAGNQTYHKLLFSGGRPPYL
jgi:hypothetical protein